MTDQEQKQVDTEFREILEDDVPEEKMESAIMRLMDYVDSHLQFIS